MPICSTFSRIIQAASRRGAMMKTMWSSLFVRFEGSIEWSYLDTIPWNLMHIWMKDVHLCLPNTSDHRIARSLWFFFTQEFLYTLMISRQAPARLAVLCIVWFDMMVWKIQIKCFWISVVNTVIGHYQCNMMSTKLFLLLFFGACQTCLLKLL